MTTTSVLAFPNNDDPFILDTDAYDTAIGAALYHIQNGVERPVSFASHILTPAETGYSTTRKELLSIVVFTRHSKHYLLCREVTVTTDHDSLGTGQNGDKSKATTTKTAKHPKRR